MRRPNGSGDSHATDAAFIAREIAQDNYDFAHRYDDEPGTPPPTPSYEDQESEWHDAQERETGADRCPPRE
jgi:hypothetical protein